MYKIINVLYSIIKFLIALIFAAFTIFFELRNKVFSKQNLEYVSKKTTTSLSFVDTIFKKIENSFSKIKK